MRKNAQNKEIRYIDLFGGVGGFRLGIERVFGNRKPGKPVFKCVFYCEIDKYCVQVYDKQFQEEYEPKDITTVRAKELPDFDLLCAGFPCQAFSIAGKRQGFNDIRGTLFFEIARIIRAKRPKFVFLENVKGLLNHQKGKTYRIILQALSELGYEFQWMVLNSKFFGVPQNRERVFIIGNLRGQRKPEILPFREIARAIPGIPQNQIVYDRKGFDSRTKGFRESMNESPTLSTKMGTGGNNVPMVSCAYRTRTYCGQEGHIETRKDKIANQLTSCQKDSMVLTKERIRRLTPVECERLQGFPDNWTEGVSDTQRYKMMGNAVTVNVIEAIVNNWFG